MYDIVIRGGTLIEPKRKMQTVASIGLKDGKIKAITRESITGKEEIDATGKIVCPGFVDIHSHLSLPLYPAWVAVKQGITTCLTGNCGMNSHFPIGDFLDQLEQQGYPLNIGTLVGHSWKLRELAGLEDPYQVATKEQIQKMVELAEEGLSQGAFGISFGLEYAPGCKEEELLPLFELAARYDKLAPVHIRTDALDFAVGLREAIHLMEMTGAKLQVSHLAYQFGVHSEVTEMALVMIRNAYEKGLPIMCDSGVYEAFATFVQSPVFDEGWHKRYGCELSDLMISSGKYTGQRCTPEIFQEVRNNPEEAETIGTAFVGAIPDLGRAIKPEFTMISTDGGLGDKPGSGHPQDAGTYPRVFQKLVREQGFLSMMEAVEKSSWIPAQRMGLKDKGHLSVGADGDIVVFDARKIKDEADYVGLGSPDASPAGLQAVIVNGVTVVREGQARENTLPGKVLRQPNHPWTL